MIILGLVLAENFFVRELKKNDLLYNLGIILKNFRTR